MFSYYGSKTNLIPLYPKPKFDRIIEPFAGAAKYSLTYFEKDVLLVDKYPIIIDVWKWLQQCSEQDILKLPRRIPNNVHFDDLNFDCPEQRYFYGFICGCGDARPRNKTTKRKTIDRPNHINFNLQRVAKELFKIRHWKFKLADYESISNQQATWFIDPPYQYGGSAYVMSNKNIDFDSLSQWCKDRQGQIIVCENTKATWMDFNAIAKQRGSTQTTIEAMWTNSNNFQQQILDL
jgi:site-specific DNA-adenine methylase